MKKIWYVVVETKNIQAKQTDCLDNCQEGAEELLLKHEDDELVLTIVSVENLHIQLVLTSTVVDTNSNNMMEINWHG